jgi:hypothetical protein
MGMRIKSLLFHVVLFLPLSLLILLLSDIVKGIYILNNTDYRRIEEELTEYLSTKEPVSFPMPVEPKLTVLASASYLFITINTLVARAP